MIINFPFCNDTNFGFEKHSDINALIPISWPLKKTFWMSETQLGWKYRTDCKESTTSPKKIKIRRKINKVFRVIIDFSKNC